MIDRGFSFLFKKSGERVEIGNLIVCTEDSYKSGVVRLVFEGKNPNENSSANGKISFLLRPPFLVRSAVTGDLVKTVDGKYKNLSDVFNNWKIPSVKRSEVLVVEEFGGGKSAVRAVIASFIGAKNWIVEDAKL